MGGSHSNFSLYGKSPFYQLLFSLMIILFAGMFLFPVLLLAGTLILGGDIGDWLKNTINEVGEKEISFVRCMMISQEVSIFLIPGMIILSLMKPDHQKNPMDFEKPVLNDVILVILLAFCILPLTSFTGQLNSGMHLPDWLYSVERWMKEKEDNATRMIDLLIAANTFWIMVFNVFMLAVIPAVGEELIFRGVFQKIFYKLFKSCHLAIWVTAFAFSALHLQFFGFFPRFILGLIFGYLYYWSGTLWLPVISHFVNNAVPVILAYIQGWNKSRVSFDSLLWKQIIVLPLMVIACIIILQYFRNKHKKKIVAGNDRSQVAPNL
jgi:uncharacterized protein